MLRSCDLVSEQWDGCGTYQCPVVARIMVARAGRQEGVILRSVILEVQDEAVVLSVDHHCIVRRELVWQRKDDSRPNGLVSGNEAETWMSSVAS